MPLFVWGKIPVQNPTDMDVWPRLAFMNGNNNISSISKISQISLDKSLDSDFTGKFNGSRNLLKKTRIFPETLMGHHYLWAIGHKDRRGASFSQPSRAPTCPSGDGHITVLPPKLLVTCTI